MCQKINYLSRTQNGFLIQCCHSKDYQLCYKNLNFNLTRLELERFNDFLLKINANYWEKEYENSIYEKKIPIPSTQTNFIILIDRYELDELIFLLAFEKKKECITFEDIRYPMNLN